nr:reverse transcriptase zinc-binding domain-containing protein [Tanacetum cinerariifolium]
SHEARKLAWKWKNVISSYDNGDLNMDARCIIDSKILPSLAPSTVWDKNIPRKDARCIIDSKILPSLAPSTVWDKNIPRKVNISIWRLILDRFPQKLYLSSRGIDIQAISCPAYNGKVESSNHIFFGCKGHLDACS